MYAVALIIKFRKRDLMERKKIDALHVRILSAMQLFKSGEWYASTGLENVKNVLRINIEITGFVFDVHIYRADIGLSSFSCLHKPLRAVIIGIQSCNKQC